MAVRETASNGCYRHFHHYHVVVDILHSRGKTEELKIAAQSPLKKVKVGQRKSTIHHLSPVS